MEELEGRVAFVTGGASGIGLGICRAALEAGMSVMMADIEITALEEARSALEEEGAERGWPQRLASVECDVADSAAVASAADATLARFDKVHLVCNNAGVSTGGLIEDLDEGDWEWTIGVNYLGVLHGCQAFVPILKSQQEGGHIVNTSSMAGLLGGMAGWGPYNSTKFAVVGLTEVLRQEGRLGGFGASVLCPGGVATNIFDAPRNRSERYGPQKSEVAIIDPGRLSEGGRLEGLDSDVVGQLVLEAVCANRLYIFTDPRFAGTVAGRFDRIASDFSWAAASKTLTSAKAPGSNADSSP